MAVADLDAAFLPPPGAVREGFTVFHVLKGKLFRLGGTQWEDISEAIPTGKVWLTPEFELREREDGAWRTLARA